MLWNKLNPYRAIDNAPLIVFRMLFGVLIAAESFGYIITGKLYKVYILPEFTLAHLGFEWIQPLPGNWMYVYFVVMGICGLLIAVGLFYRTSMLLFAVLWTGTYLMQISFYNNHYYLMVLISFMMVLLPAHHYASLDVVRKPSLKQLNMPFWVSLLMIIQISIVYLYAAKAKIYPDWLDGTFASVLFNSKKGIPIIGSIFSEHWFHLFISYSGIAFDALIVPMLIWRKTRNLAFFASLIFHLFNSIVLQIGIFPYFALAFCLFFYPPDQIRKWFLRKKPALSKLNEVQQENSGLWKYLFIPYLIIQSLLPLRHHFMPGNVFWTEEGHRYSWRMMLRTRSGSVKVKIVDKNTGEVIPYNVLERLTGKQQNAFKTKPDAMWQIAQRLKREFAAEGREVAVYIDAKVSLNAQRSLQFTDPEVDLASVKWNFWGHNDWVIIYSDEELFGKAK